MEFGGRVLIFLRCLLCLSLRSSSSRVVARGSSILPLLAMEVKLEMPVALAVEIGAAAVLFHLCYSLSSSFLSKGLNNRITQNKCGLLVPKGVDNTPFDFSLSAGCVMIVVATY